MKIKKSQRNMKKFGKVLKKKLERLMMAKKLNMEKILKKLGLSLMMTYDDPGLQWSKQSTATQNNKKIYSDSP